MTHYASVRVERLKTIRDIQAATAHANRQDATSQMRLREGADSKLNLRHNPWIGGRVEEPGAPFDYVQDFKTMKAARNVAERKGTAPVAHFICVVSPGWIEEAGNVHDPENVRNVQLFEHARTWAANNFGEGSVLSARMDMDEKGAGVVDLFVAPSVQSKKGNNFLSVSPALKEIQKKYRRRNTFAGLQDSWAEYVQKHLDPAIQRGKEKEGVGPDRLTPENYAARAENERSAAELATQKAELHAAMALVKKELEDAIAAKRRADERDWQLAGEQARVDRLKSDLDIREVKLVEREKKLDADITENQSELAQAYRDLAEDEVRLHQGKDNFGAEKIEFFESVASFESDREAFEQRKNDLAERERKLLAPQDEFDRRVREEAARRADGEINAVNARLRTTTLELEDAKKLAGMVRTIPLGRVMKMLGGARDANEPLQWRLPNLGFVVISSKNPNRFVTTDKKARGSGAVDLVMAETGSDFRAAVRMLAVSEPLAEIASDAAYAAAVERGREAVGLVREKILELDESAAAAPGERAQIKKALTDRGISADLIEMAIDRGQLEATKQGNRLFCRWTLRDEAGQAVGYSLRSLDGSFAAIRGKQGIFTLDVGGVPIGAGVESAPQIWVADEPEGALAAIAACRRLDILSLKPASNARAIAIDVSPKSLDWLAKQAVGPGLGVVLCLAIGEAGVKFAAELRQRLQSRNVKIRDLSWVLKALQAANWRGVALRMQNLPSKMIADLRRSYDERIAEAERRRKQERKSRGI